MFTKGTKVVHPKHGVCEYISTPLCRNDGRDVARIKLQDGRVVGVLLDELSEVKPVISSWNGKHIDDWSTEEQEAFLAFSAKRNAADAEEIASWLDIESNS